MKIIIYTINDCQFSKQEKDYLTGHSLQYEEKNVETNRELLTEMLAASNNFAGTPVTKIEKDDGQIVVLKGFTKEEFDQALDLTAPKVAVAESSVTPPQPTPPQPTPPPTPPTPTTPSEPTPPKPAVEIPPLEIPPAPPVETPPAPPVTPSLETPSVAPTPPPNDQLNSILNDLQQKAGA